MSAATDPIKAAVDLLRIACAFDFPRPEFWEQVEGRAVNDLIGSAESRVIPRRTQAEREADYQGAFDIDGAPLYEGFHRGTEGREGILEDVMRFYSFFDLRLSETERDYPDYLVTELEFLSFLVMMEADAKARGNDPRPFQLAQRDFTSRHLGIWLPALARRLEATGCESTIYPDLAEALQKFVEARHDWLQEELEGGVL